MNEVPFRWLVAPAIAVAASGVHATQYLSVEEAQRLMFPDAVQFESRLIKLTAEQKSAVESASGVRVRQPEQKVWIARSQDRVLGWFIVDEVFGKHEFITYAVALDSAGAVRQIEVMNYRESYGYEIRKPEWRGQFTGKTRSDPLKLEADIKNISGATLSCVHVTDGVRRLLALHAVALR
ncbi:MAG: FMN-binding protein [Cyanobacteria bacterium]|nr:FMN-binding protein [Cyanobacteriota bacterium]